MAVEYPSDLIQQLQISVRKEAGIAANYNYNYNDDEDDDLHEAIGRLDRSCPAYLRCNECGGRLVRGIQSIVCIYCGSSPPHRNPPPDPIPFKSTFAYRSLLQSLHLTGSEAVEGNAITLSHLLNIHLKCPLDSAQNGAHIPNPIKETPLNLAGVDLDHFFTHPQDPSGWEPQFQSPLNSTLLPFPDASQSQAQIKLKFDGNGMDMNLNQTDVLMPQASASDSWTENDQWHGSNIESSTNTIKLEMNQDKHPTHDLNNLFPTNNNLFQDDLWLSSVLKHTEAKSFDAWQDFTSSGNASHPFPTSSNPTNILETSTNKLPPRKSLASSSNDVQDDFDSLRAPSLFLGTNNASTSVNDVQEGSYSDRLAEMISGDLKSTENTNRNVDNTAADNTAETLMAQMNDLSFMLEGDLSVPEKQKKNGVDFNCEI